MPTVRTGLLRPIVATLALAAPALAQQASSDSPNPTPPSSDLRDATRPTRTQPQEERAFNLSFRPRVEHTFDADLRDSNGSVNTTRAGATLGLAAPLGERARLLVNVDGEWSRYNWSDVGDLLPSGKDPITNAYQVRLSPSLVYSLDEEWSLTGGAIIEFAGEGGADVGDSVTYGGFFGARYRWSERLTTTFGVIAKTRLEDDFIAVPLLGIEWKITDTVTLENEGLGLKLRAAMNEQWRFGVFARYELRDYRLDDDGSVPGGVLRDQRVPVGVSVEWRPSPGVQVELSGGAVVYQKYQFDNSDGDRIRSDRARVTPFVGLTATLAF